MHLAEDEGAAEDEARADPVDGRELVLKVPHGDEQRDELPEQSCVDSDSKRIMIQIDSKRIMIQIPRQFSAIYVELESKRITKGIVF